MISPVSALLVLLLSVLLLFGVKNSSLFNVVCTCINLVILLFFIIFGAVYVVSVSRARAAWGCSDGLCSAAPGLLDRAGLQRHRHRLVGRARPVQRHHLHRARARAWRLRPLWSGRHSQGERAPRRPSDCLTCSHRRPAFCFFRFWALTACPRWPKRPLGQSAICRRPFWGRSSSLEVQKKRTVLWVSDNVQGLYVAVSLVLLGLLPWNFYR